MPQESFLFEKAKLCKLSSQRKRVMLVMWTNNITLARTGNFALLVTVPDGDMTVGFDGCPAHTHGSILAELFGCDEETAVARFVAEIVESKQVIAIWRVAGRRTDAWLPRHEGRSLRDEIAGLLQYGETNETVEFRLWDGTTVEQSDA